MKSGALAGPRLIAIATDSSSDPKDVIAAARVLLEFGLGRQMQVDGQVEHDHRFIIEVPRVARDALEWAVQYRDALEEVKD